jgi:hypothetical protein
MRVRNLKALPMIDFFIIVELDVPFLASPFRFPKRKNSQVLSARPGHVLLLSV